MHAAPDLSGVGWPKDYEPFSDVAGHDNTVGKVTNGFES